MKKYELTENVKEVYGRRLFQIRALKDFSDVKAGELGGWIEKEENLSQEWDCWVYDNARVHGNAQVYDNALVYGGAQVYGGARVSADSDYTTIKGFGSACRSSTFFRCKDGLIRVSCGCFLGTIEEFKRIFCWMIIFISSACSWRHMLTRKIHELKSWWKEKKDDRQRGYKGF